ncbi:rifamycin-inactivating phosphotransferase [Lentzea sp. NBRC 102530]|uniref:rifamycin-inactivating phosphotransferase n=1 Tax=Lentzea sp. NBRC 102530 TaxID=3032201 RepID=UPI0024A56183|nr:rifamycin-inactivating phosphotransferase [Lentzea sp. NBRC 102530]GLY50420.1 putative phosphoenolpyruvate synthase [Lentzea sp. NBRC 102530]
MSGYVLGFGEIDAMRISLCGGKGAHLAELSRLGDVQVPPGFCVTTEAFDRALQEAPPIGTLLDELEGLAADDLAGIRVRSAEVRQEIERLTVPADVAAGIAEALVLLGDRTACAVRSSATAEDLPGASFAGQQDTYLNVVGTAEVLRHVTRCWASLFTERAVSYRLRNGFGHRGVRMAVVVQRMAFPDAAGVLFTADPVTSNRRISCAEAVFGLGEAFVSGLVNADVYRVLDDEVIEKTVATKHLALRAVPEGGTREEAVEPARRRLPALTDAQVVHLTRLGRRIEEHFGGPQDIEWCLTGGEFQIVQSRPITTLFPVPETADGDNHVYVSVGHQQMMTDAMKPLGLSVWQLTTPRPMAVAAGRLFVDVTRILAAPQSRTAFLDVADRSDPLMGDALRTVLGRTGFVPASTEPGPSFPGVAQAEIDTDPDVVTELIGNAEASLAALEQAIRDRSGPDLVGFVLADFEELRRILFDPRGNQVITAGMQATWWLNENLLDWLGEKNAADSLSLSAPHNVTSEMGLALLDVADALRPHPEVVAYLQHAGDDFLDELPRLPGGAQARDAVLSYLGRYGMRCVGEIDITRTRWGESPAALLPMILTNVRNFTQGAAARRFDQGVREAWQKEQEVLERLLLLPDGEQKAADTKRMIDRVRTFIGYREYPKYGMISRYFVYKKALLAEAGRLTAAGLLESEEDCYFLTLQELHDLTLTGRRYDEVVRDRRIAFASYESLTPPRVLTSDGETVNGRYRRDDLPSGALSGLAVSGGVVEGRARVVLNVADADLEPGDVLVTAYTDPSWSPLFVQIAGLVTEVGGMMTHGAVIAREYGLPAVVGVEQATRTIRDGQRIRVNGTDGFIEVLGEP